MLDGLLTSQGKPQVKGLAIATNEVDIWQIDLAGTGEGIRQCRRLLSSDEVQRADRFYFDRDRVRFTVARAAMREILGYYAGLAPQHLRFSYGSKGKPELSGGLQESRIRFNLAHSLELALLAVTHGLTVGVDIERVKSDFVTDDIAEHSFSASELQALRSLPTGQRIEAFFSCWTRKEAYIKALGEGLSLPLDSFAVAFVPGIRAELLHVKANPAEVERWSMYDIAVKEGYKAALVVEGKGHLLRRMRWGWALPK